MKPKDTAPAVATLSARERLFNQARRTERVTLTTGDVVEIRALSMTDRTKLAKACQVDDDTDMELLIPTLVIACVFYSDSGEPMFTAGDRDTIAGLPACDVDPMWNAAARMNGFTRDAAKTAEKN